MILFKYIWNTSKDWSWGNYNTRSN